MSKNKVLKSKRFVAVWDIHAGWEYKRIRGGRRRMPTHNLRALRAVVQFIGEYKPDVIILGGDQLNCGPISHWHKGQPRLAEGFRLKAELDLMDREFLTPVDHAVPCATKIWLDGNHEEWIERWLDANPGVAGLVEPKNYLNLEKRGWDLHSLGEIYRLGKLYFIHGDTIRTGLYKARRLVGTYRRNIRCGHFHTLESWTDVTPIDRQDYHTGIVVPAMSSRGPAYQKNAADSFMQGFLIGETYSNGDFWDQVVIINRNRFYHNGVKYPHN